MKILRPHALMQKEAELLINAHALLAAALPCSYVALGRLGAKDMYMSPSLPIHG